MKIQTLLKINAIFVIGFLFLSSCSNVKKEKPKPKNIIFLIGDGMGLSQITTANVQSDNTLVLLKLFKKIGLIKTHSSDNLITDSAAGATAFACGKKTYNGAIGVDSDSNIIKNLVEMLSHSGINTGVVATSSVTHATPAAFAAHQVSREMHPQIADDMMHSELDLMIGGGATYFRQDSLEHYGFEAVYGDNIFNYVGSNKLAGFYNRTLKHCPAIDSGRGNFLVKASGKAIDFLDNYANDKNKGFFLMIEGSQIDWGGHARNTDYVVSELLDFDQSIAKAMEFAMKDKNTLVIVTADHETGGLALNGKDSTGNLKTSFAHNHHTGTMVPVFAYGPGASEFEGVYENTDIFDKILMLLKGTSKN